jgi:RNA polymerase sigma-70 factor (ECF subfamily)
MLAGVSAIEKGVEDPEEVAAIGRLYERHAREVFAYAQRRSDSQTAEDVTARVFLVAWRRRTSVPADALPWLYGVARRVLADERRSSRRRASLGRRLGARWLGEVERVDEGGDGSLAAALERLSERDREILLLSYWEDLAPEQVAVVLGCSRSTLAVRLHRARRRLSRALTDGPMHGTEEVGDA